MTFDDTTTAPGWSHPPVITLRHTHRATKVERAQRDLDAARGIMLSAAIGAALIAWAIVAVEFVLL